jgi:hypothetical protein
MPVTESISSFESSTDSFWFPCVFYFGNSLAACKVHRGKLGGKGGQIPHQYCFYLRMATQSSKCASGVRVGKRVYISYIEDQFNRIFPIFLT